MTGAPRPRLNPFAFPSDTAFRFGLLVVAVLGANLYVWQWLSSTSRSAVTEARAALECLQISPAGATTAAEFEARQAAFSACVNGLYRYQLWWMLGGTAALLAVAAGLALAAPWWVRRRRRLQPFVAADAPALAREIERLAAEQGIARPALWWSPTDPSAGGLAFGRPGAYAIGFGGGLVVRHTTDPAAFRAVVRHELAHIRNRDVALTYGAIAVALAFALVSVAPFLVTLIDEGSATFFGLAWRLAALGALVYLTLAAVLRSREIYADVRASVHDGPEGALRTILAALPVLPAGVLRRLRSVHPAPADRMRAIDDTRPLFTLPALVAFAAGLTATIAFEGVVQLLSTSPLDAFDQRVVAALAFVPLAVGVVGAGLWRESFAAVAEGRRAPRPWVDALAFTGGLLLGPELALERQVRADQTILGSLDSFDGLLWLGALVGVVAILLAWIDASATAWLTAGLPRRPRVALPAGLVTASGAVAAFLGVYFGVRATSETLAFSRRGSEQIHAFVDAQVWTVPLPVFQFVLDSELAVIAHKPYFLPILAALALFPAAAALVRSRGAGDAGWAFLDPGGSLEPRDRPSSLRPLAIGAAAGAAFLLLVVPIRLYVHYGIEPATRAGEAGRLSIFVFIFCTALVATAAAGAFAGWGNGLVSALPAAFVAASISWLGLSGGSLYACLEPLSINPGPCGWSASAGDSWNTYRILVAQGAVVGLAGGALAQAARRLWAARGRREELHAVVAP